MVTVIVLLFRVFKNKADAARGEKVENFKAEIEIKIKADFNRMGRL